MDSTGLTLAQREELARIEALAQARIAEANARDAERGGGILRSESNPETLPNPATLNSPTGFTEQGLAAGPENVFSEDPAAIRRRRVASDLRSRFGFHPSTPVSGPVHEQIRELYYELAMALDPLCPDGREWATTLTKLEESMFWANASVAREQPLA